MKALDLLAALPAMLWTAGADGVWTHVNRRWVEYTGQQGAPSRFGFEGALHPDDVAPTVARWMASVRTGEPYQAEYRVRRHDGEYRWFLTYGVHTPELDPDVMWTGTCTDINDQKQAEQDAAAARHAAVRALGLALEARDHATKGHTDRVTTLAVRLGLQAGLAPSEVETLRLGAYLHDIGKIALSDALLLKPGHLTPAERLEMQQHVDAGVQFAAALGFLSEEVLDVIRGHHERWDGTGYPAGLRGHEIPRSARIFALADVYDALVSERPYKPAWSQERALTELTAQAGGQFDPQLTALFVHTLGARPPALTPHLEVHSTSQVQSVASEHLQALALQAVAVSVLLIDPQQRLIYANPAFCRQTGYSPDEVLGRNMELLHGPNTEPEGQRRLRDGLRTGHPVQHLLLNYSKQGEELWLDVQMMPIVVEGQVQYFVVVLQDRSVQMADHARLEDLATHDPLTGLLNRLSLDAALANCPVPSTLIFLDLDNFKGINDRDGHQAGDGVLRRVAQVLTAHTPPGGQVFRLGGDEFLILLPTGQVGDAQQWVTQLHGALAAVQTGDAPLTGSFGLAFFPAEGRDLWALMGLADERMYQGKVRAATARRAASKARPPDG